MQSAEELLKKYWGYDEFLHPQKEIIEAVLSGADTLAIMPTGGGKSLCYQLPSLMLDGLTLVISPLIALMQDQIQNLNEKGIPAAAISSQLSKDEIATVISRCSLGKIKLLYISPERLQSRFFLQSLQHLHVSRIAVDEAHCISQWGHDFRPSYLRIHLIREMFPEVNMLALTATAHPKTVLEIISALKLKNSKIFKRSLKRENLTYKITRTLNELDDLVYVLKKHAGAGIVFVRTRRKSYETAEFLKASGFNAEF
ncbi:MAG: RecQ family ATP-dependent DNA helicase, partial [Weeksellaceae bacterium]|nr:RecQ family ATP-dependent DNA helicase [Weeksellaceae bacterium]